MMMAPALHPRRRLEARDEKDPVSRHDLPDTGRRWHTGSLRARKRGGAPWVVLADASWPAASDHLASRALPGGAPWRRSRNSAHEYCSWTRDLSSNKRAARVCRVGAMVDDPRREVFAWDAEIKVAKKSKIRQGCPPLSSSSTSSASRRAPLSFLLLLPRS